MTVGNTTNTPNNRCEVRRHYAHHVKQLCIIVVLLIWINSSIHMSH